MSDRDRLFLTHILSAIDEIHTFISEGRRGFETDRKTQSAVLRQLEIIGEAVKHLSADLRTRAGHVPWRQIAGMRDRLIHGYFVVDLQAVWSTIEIDLPVLREQVRRILEEGADPAPSPRVKPHSRLLSARGDEVADSQQRGAGHSITLSAQHHGTRHRDARCACVFRLTASSNRVTEHMLRFTAVFRKVPEGHVGFVQELPGANTQGASLDEARSNLSEAVELVLDANRALSEESIEGQEVIREVLVLSGE